MTGRGAPERPSCVVAVAELVEEKRPRFTSADGVGSKVRRLGDPTGLTQMGVNLREVQPDTANRSSSAHTEMFASSCFDAHDTFRELQSK